MASILPSAWIGLSVFLSLGFNSAHRVLLDQTNGDHKNKYPVHHEAVKNPEAEGTGSTDRSSGYISGRDGYVSAVESRTGSGSGGSGYGSGRGDDIIRGMLPVPRIQWPCDEPVHPGGPRNPGKKKGPEHQTVGESATGAAKEMQEAINIVSEPYPPNIDRNQP